MISIIEDDEYPRVVPCALPFSLPVMDTELVSISSLACFSC